MRYFERKARPNPLVFRIQRGFSLIEVLIATVMLALILGAVVQTAGQYTRSVNHIHEHTIAHWVALNTLNDLRLEQEWPEWKHRSGELDMAGRIWIWQGNITETSVPNVRLLRVTVAAEERPTNSVAQTEILITRPSLQWYTPDGKPTGVPAQNPEDDSLTPELNHGDLRRLKPPVETRSLK